MLIEVTLPSISPSITSIILPYTHINLRNFLLRKTMPISLHCNRRHTTILTGHHPSLHTHQQTLHYSVPSYTFPHPVSKALFSPPPITAVHTTHGAVLLSLKLKHCANDCCHGVCNPTVHSHGSVALTTPWTVYRGKYRQPIAIKQCSIQFLSMFSAQECVKRHYIYRV